LSAANASRSDTSRLWRKRYIARENAGSNENLPDKSIRLVALSHSFLPSMQGLGDLLRCADVPDFACWLPAFCFQQ
jgi:hypothetical protein